MKACPHCRYVEACDAIGRCMAEGRKALCAPPWLVEGRAPVPAPKPAAAPTAVAETPTAKPVRDPWSGLSGQCFEDSPAAARPEAKFHGLPELGHSATGSSLAGAI
jgi:hypothetical protein